jgi:hypothetical protein
MLRRFGRSRPYPRAEWEAGPGLLGFRLVNEV